MHTDFTAEKTYSATRAPVNFARTLIPDAYRSQDFFKQEQNKIFKKSWVCVGYTDQLREKDSTFITSVAGQSLLLTRDVQNQIRGFYNVCRHRGSQLISEDGKYKTLRCPYHSWSYNTSGKLLVTPNFKGNDTAEKEFYSCDSEKQFCKDDYSLLSVRVETWGCLIFVNLDENARPLLEWLGDLPERLKRYPLEEMKIVKRVPYTVQANWKLIAENFMEYYHLPSIHPELVKVSKLNLHYRYQGPGMYMGFCTSPLTNDPGSPFDLMKAMPGLNPVEAESAFWIHIFPNISLFVLPNHIFTLVLKPESPGVTYESTDLLVHPSSLQTEADVAHLEAIFQYWDRVNRQDFEAVQRVQIGVSLDAYPGGRMCERFEEPLHRFQNMVIDRMVGINRIPAGDKEAGDSYFLSQNLKMNETYAS